MQINDRVKRILSTGVLVAGLIMSGCGSQQAAPKPAIPEVAIVTVNPERVVLTTELPGRTSAYFVAEIRPQVNGIILKRLFEEGSDVKAGDVLYQIDPAPFQAAYDNAAANLAVTRKTPDRARAALEASMAGVKRQQATLELARANRWRFEELFKGRGTGTERPGGSSRCRSGHPSGGSGAGNGQNQSGIHPDHSADQWTNRKIQRDRGRSRKSVSRFRLRNHPTAGSDLCGRDRVKRQPAAAQTEHSSRSDQRHRYRPGTGEVAS
jgi:hypothetical protein